MKSGQKMFTVDQFLGVNEAADGYTEIKMGEASAMQNFLVTDAANLRVRPGIRRVDFELTRDPAPILAMWSGHIGDGAEVPEDEYLVIVDFAEGRDRFWMYSRGSGDWVLALHQDGALGLTQAEGAVVKIFAFGSRLYVMSTGRTAVLEDGSLLEAKPYIPKVIAGAAPAGGGATLENINLLTGLRREDFSSDGESTAYVLPEEATEIVKVTVDNEDHGPGELGSFDAASHTYSFATAPEKGVGNVEFVYDTDAAAAEKSRQAVLQMPLVEAYNGSTDTRIFVAGVGNICYYSGVTEAGAASPLYFPAMNEVKVDVTAAQVTGLVRHYSKLLVFTREGAYTISYEPVTQTDGSTVAGFYLRTMNREFGNDAVGQIQTVNNYPRTIAADGIYEWHITTSYYKDERYAKRVSDKVRRSLRGLDTSRVVTCDDNYSKTYYVFLNDSAGTVLVNRYDMGKEGGIWCIYESPLCTDVRFAVMSQGVMVFGNGTEAFYFDEELTMDAAKDPAGTPTAIRARWESGFMDFGADFQRKYSSQIYVSMLPQSNSELIITAATDKRSEYLEKSIKTNLFAFPNFNFSTLTFDLNDTPQIQRVRLKVKKFVYYKLIFRVEEPGSGATIMSYDQIVRYASMAK